MILLYYRTKKYCTCTLLETNQTIPVLGPTIPVSGPKPTVPVLGPKPTVPFWDPTVLVLGGLYLIWHQSLPYLCWDQSFLKVCQAQPSWEENLWNKNLMNVCPVIFLEVDLSYDHYDCRFVGRSVCHNFKFYFPCSYRSTWFTSLIIVLIFIYIPYVKIIQNVLQRL